MGHGSAHIYMQEGRVMDKETVDKQLDRIARSVKYEEIKEKVITTIRLIFKGKDKEV